jgi:hypothetical protein
MDHAPGRGLERVSLSFPAELPGGDAAQLAIDQGEDPLGGLRVSRAPPREQVGDGVFGHKVSYLQETLAILDGFPGQKISPPPGDRGGGSRA